MTPPPITARDTNNNTAKIGDKISFLYKGVPCEGIVRVVYVNSVLVTLTHHEPFSAQIMLDDETIVNYKHYKIISKGD